MKAFTAETRAMDGHSLVLEDNSFDMNRGNRRALIRVPTSPAPLEEFNGCPHRSASYDS
jgi:hypothetical protein